MRLRRLIGSVIFCVALLNLACDSVYGTTAAKIKDILDHPRDYQSQDITVSGTVTNAVSLLVVKYYEIQDGTGSIKIVTDRLLPTRGEKLKVTGRMTVVEVGTERWVVLRENPNPAGQFVESTNRTLSNAKQDGGGS
jgi:aspartyl/asparaginyl-tRNA synthetase